MVKKLRESENTENSKAAGEQLKSSVRDSAQQIWQAGLGAFAKAQAEGTRAFEALVKEGNLLQRKTQTVAEERISEASSKMSNMASDISSRASGHWDKLETIFEDRVAKALGKLGVPSAQDVNALKDRIHTLDKTVDSLSKRPGPTAGPAAKRTSASGAKSVPGSAARSASKPKSAPGSAAKAAAKVAPKAAAQRTAPRKNA